MSIYPSRLKNPTQCSVGVRFAVGCMSCCAVGSQSFRPYKGAALCCDPQQGSTDAHDATSATHGKSQWVMIQQSINPVAPDQSRGNSKNDFQSNGVKILNRPPRKNKNKTATPVELGLTSSAHFNAILVSLSDGEQFLDDVLAFFDKIVAFARIVFQVA